MLHGVVVLRAEAVEPRDGGLVMDRLIGRYDRCASGVRRARQLEKMRNKSGLVMFDPLIFEATSSNS